MPPFSLRFTPSVIATAFMTASIGLSACSGGGGGKEDRNTNANDVVIAGNVVASAVANATVNIVAVAANGNDGENLGSTQTAADGSFKVILNHAPSGAVRIRATGGSYTSEADVSKTVSDGVDLSVVVENATLGVTGLTVNPLTTFQDAYFRQLLASGKNLAAAIQDSSDKMRNIYGLHDSATSTTKSASEGAALISGLSPDFNATEGNGAKLALILGTLEQLAKDKSLASKIIVKAIANDLADGTPNGKDSTGALVTYTDGAQASTLSGPDFFGALNRYLESDTTLPHTSGIDLAKLKATAASISTALLGELPTSSCTNIGSSGAITCLAFDNKQLVYVAAREKGLAAVDITDTKNPTVIDLTTLNTALADLKNSEGHAAPLATIGGVIAIPGTNNVALFSYDQARVVIADAAKQVVLQDVDLSATLTEAEQFSGGSAYIAGGIPDPVRGVIWLATPEGYYPFDYSTGTLQSPIALAPTGDEAQTISENIGADIVGKGLLFSPNYGAGGEYSGGTGGLQIADTTKSKAYALNDDQFAALFKVNFNGAETPFGIVDAGSVDTVYHVGVLTPEDNRYVGLFNLNQYENFTFDDATGQFTVPDALLGSASKTVILGDGLYSGATVSGSAVESTNHLALFMAGYSSDIAVGKIDAPTNPTGGGDWKGLSNFKTYSAQYNEYQYSRDPHAAGAVLGMTDNRSYGFLYSDCGSILMVDMQAFVDAEGDSASHKLNSSPFENGIVKSLPIKGSTCYAP